MNTKKELKIMFPHPPGGGGPGSFQLRFEDQLKKTGHTVLYKGDSTRPDLIFVVGGTKSLLWLFKMKIKGIPIIYRLDGIGWLHKKKKVSLKYYFIAESRNGLSKIIHGFIATKIIYQSKFVEGWWQDKAWRQRKNTTIIHNGVHIPSTSFVNNALQSRKSNRLVILEGVIDYSPYAIRLLNDLAKNLPKNIVIEVYGKLEKKAEAKNLNPRINYKGFLPRDKVYEVMAGAVYLSLDIHPACPNTVAEAMACGAPVVGFDTGAIPELIDKKSGKVIYYGSNPWNLDYPDVNTLISGITDVFKNYEYYSTNAYLRAIANYDKTDMLNKYLNVIHN